jgi:hypothetical protein
MRFLRALLGLSLLIGCAMVPPQSNGQSPDSTRKEIETALHDRKPMVLVVAPAGQKQDEDEAYADWAEYLNQFKGHADPSLRIKKLTLLRFRRLFVQPKIKGPYAAIFVRDLDHVLVYDGMIVEPKVYKIASDYLKGNPDAKLMANYGLEEKSARFQ